jgi:hypothetical protein
MSKNKKPEVEPEPEPQEEVEQVVTGSGEFVFLNGSRYVGDWKSTGDVKQRDGEGTYTNGPEEYTGQWVDDRMEGRGKHTFSSGAVYEGELVNNMFEGTGTYRFPDGSTYR